MWILSKKIHIINMFFIHVNSKYQPSFGIPSRMCTCTCTLNIAQRKCICRIWQVIVTVSCMCGSRGAIYKTAQSVMIDFCCLVYETSLRLVLRVRFRRHRANILVPLSGQVVDLSPPLFHFLLIAHMW